MHKLPAFLRPIEELYVKWKMRNSRFQGSRMYWEHRYAKGGNSGPGSYDRYATYKAGIVNAIIDRHAINSAIEFGCGDGNQLAMIHYPSYIGLDISPTAVAVCSRKFAADGTKAFRVYDPATFNPEEPGNRAHLGVSMDVLFHLVEEDVFLTYLKHLFAASDQYVVIYARDVDGPQYFHERNRSFTSRLSEVAPGWRLVEKMASPFHQEARDQAASENVADFFFFEKKVS